jgi:chemotaxis signal transduction protein
MDLDLGELGRRSEAALAAAPGAVDPAAEERLLRDRARRLAERQLDAAARTVVARVVVVQSGASLLGLPVASVREVRRVRVTALPHAKAPIRGVFQIWGRALALVDLGAEAQAAPLSHGEQALVALIVGAPGTLGLRIDEAIGVRDLFAEEIEAGLVGGGVEAVSSVSRDLVQIVDVERLFASSAPGFARR